MARRSPTNQIRLLVELSLPGEALIEFVVGRRLATTILRQCSVVEHAVMMTTEVIAAFPVQYRRHLLRRRSARLGLGRGEPDDDSTDATLADAAAGDEAPLSALFADACARALPRTTAQWQDTLARHTERGILCR